ncbi:MAG TPA: PorP/SprF family type IX secretion system membrane protein [Saprospiraceae bacterium]|nr:PorP/SprF family type IX secretion system membrane protein [Saprospiraceae bacterium]
MQTLRYFLFLCSCFIFTLQLTAQERYLTQFYAAPLIMDPSLTGNFDGNYRISMAYRDQWFRNLENPFSTFALSVDLSFDLNKRKRANDMAAAGLYFATDKAGLLQYGNTEMGLAGSYKKMLSPGQYLSGGLYLSLIQRNINFTNVTFEDQFNGESGYTASTGEVLGGNNFSYFDQGVGISYSNYPSKGNGFNGGIALAHLTRPEVSFLKRDEILTLTAASFRLPMKMTAHLGGKVILSEDLSLFPRLMYVRQGVQDMATIGANLRTQVNVFALHFGLWGRGAGANGKYNFDSAGLLAGIEFRNWLVGVSYDAAIPNIIHYSRNQGTFEITLSYFGLYENDDLMCPTF